MTRKTVKQQFTRDELVTKVEALLQEYQQTLAVILESYKRKIAPDDYEDLAIEILAANENINTELFELRNTQVRGWDLILQELEKLDERDIKANRLLPYIPEKDLLLNLLGGYIAVKTVDNLGKEKLEQFLTEELYPHVNDQQAYLNR